MNSTRSSLSQLDDLLQHRVRLGVCVLLGGESQLSFARLKDALQETDGNLGSHLAKLEQAGYLVVRKEFQERRPVTWYRLSGTGSARLHRHLAALDAIIHAARSARPGSG